MNEQWRDVVEYEGFYQVSNLGRVRSVDRVVRHPRGGATRRKGKILSPFPSSKYGHVAVKLCKKGVETSVQVHRIVLEAWIGPCPDGCECCHENGIASDNAVSNLRWDTRVSNGRDMMMHGNHKTTRTRIVRSDGKEYASMVDAAKDVGCAYQSISAACRDLTNYVKGYGWSYVSD